VTYDDETLNEDWIKTQGWDFATDWEAFLAQVAGGQTPAQQRVVIRELQALPMWQAAPSAIKQGADQLLGGKDG
jgi:hypothetical protein